MTHGEFGTAKTPGWVYTIFLLSSLDIIYKDTSSIKKEAV